MGELRPWGGEEAFFLPLNSVVRGDSFLGAIQHREATDVLFD